MYIVQIDVLRRIMRINDGARPTQALFEFALVCRALPQTRSDLNHCHTVPQYSLHDDQITTLLQTSI